MARSKKNVLNDTTNKKKTTKKKKKNTTSNKLDEGQWREHVLAFYRSHLAQSTYVEQNKIRSHPLRTRYDKSGLKILKQRKARYSDAVIQYDCWFKQWKSSLREKQAENRTRAQPVGFLIRVDDNEEEEEEKEVEEGDNDTSPTSDNTNEDMDGDFPGRPSIEEVEEKKPKIAKLSNLMMQQLILEFYGRLDRMPLAKYIRHVKQCWPNKNAIYSHWKDSGLEQLKFYGETIEVATNAYNNWCISQKEKQREINRSNASNKKTLPVELECFMRDLIKQLALCGQGLGKKIVRRIFIEALIDGTGKQTIARSCLNRFVRNYKLECRNVKNIDPVRISQVTPENRDSFFFRLDQIVKLCHSIDSTNCPWKDWGQVLAEYKINIDEMGSDPTKFRDVLLIPVEIMNRIFQSTPEGDRVARHLSLLVFSTADGKYKDKSAKIDGAAPPMMIHSKQSSKKDLSPAERRIYLYNETDSNPEHIDDKYTNGLERYNRNLGMKVFTSPNGSMTKELFLEAMKHLIEHLSSKQGASGLYTFLLLDSHVSRWNPQALYLLFKNRVVPIFFPSHLSIVVQPQDNGVILFLHKCIEEAAQLERLFKTDTDISYSNRIVAKGALIFRDLERKKLMTRGRNSTTRSWSVTGLDPCNPYSEGWRENLELYASMNGLKIRNEEAFRNYGVHPIDNDVCPEFTEDDIVLLEEAVPNFSSIAMGGPTILNHPKAMCYAVANDIVVNWSEIDNDIRCLRPRATSAVEKLALHHMEIVQIITVAPKSNESLVLDVNYEDRKRDGIITLTKPLESIQIQPNDTTSKSLWYSALKVNNGSWHVHNGDRYFDLTTDQLRLLYTINLNHNMFPNDKRLQENGWRSERRRRNEKTVMIQRIARTLAEEERRANLKEAFDSFMALSVEDKSFNEFECKIVTKIEKPSSHTVTVKLGTEEHVIKLSAHGNNTSAISQLVVDNICKTIIGNSNRNEKKKNKNRRRGGRVVRVRRGSDGVVKSLQMDQQHRNDLSTEEAVAVKKKNTHIALCKSRLKYIQNLQSMDRYDDIWNEDTAIQLQALKKKNLTNLLRIFNVQGRAKLLSKDPMKAALSALVITRASIDLLKANLLQQLEEYGEAYNPDVDALDSSFATNSIADISAVDTYIVNTSIIDPDISFVINVDTDRTSNDENSIGVFLESETSAGDAGSGRESDDTAELIANLPRKKTVSFNLNPTPSVRTFSGQVASSSLDDEETFQEADTVAAAASAAATSSSSSSEDLEICSPRQPTQTRRSYRCINKRTTRASKRSPTKATSSSQRQPAQTRRRTCASKRCPTTSTPPPPAAPAAPAPAVSKPVVLRRSLRHC